MIVVKVELHSAVTGKITEIARMWIANDGSNLSNNRGNYWAKTLRGRGFSALSKHKLNNYRANRTGFVNNYPRSRMHVWTLVSRCLNAMEYK